MSLLVLLVAGNTHAGGWQDFLKRDAVENIKISPNGHYLAIAERQSDATVVSIRDASTLQVLTTINPGKLGEVSRVAWLDDDRVLIGANRADTRYNIALVAPALYIVGRDGSSKYKLPANFVATIDDDPEHLLVSTCQHWEDGGCVAEVHRALIGHLSRLGDPLISAPDSHATLWADNKGNVRFAESWDDDGESKLHVHRAAGNDWTLVNDSIHSGIDSVPLGIARDGKTAFLLANDRKGLDVVQRYDIASGKIAQVYQSKVSDPIATIHAFDGNVPIGGYYGPTDPKPVIWNPDHPDVPALLQIFNAFPGKLVSVTSTSRDRNLAIVAVSDDRDPGAFYLFDRKAHKATLLARRRPWLSGATMPRTRPLAFTARDGTPLHALLTLPPNREPKDLPMVVVPHGGPYDIIDVRAFDAEADILASQGYAVLRVNYRGSGGYGRAFKELGYRQWGRKMQDDITDATRHVIDAGTAQASRICIYGASYGGYAALMGAVREPGLYRCVASYAAPTDLSKLYKWGNIRRSDLGKRYLERVIGNDDAELAARSPVDQVASIKVPVLLAHGRLDARVDRKHAKLLAKKLKQAGGDIEYVEYPHEGHGLYIEQDQLDFYGKLLVFLQHNIGAAQPR